MIEPMYAPVRPRVLADGSRDSVLLEEIVADHAAAGNVHTIVLMGGVGAGMTTALQHLAQVFGVESGLHLIDGLPSLDSGDTESLGLIRLRIGEPTEREVVVKYHLAGWKRDEWIEYLLAVHHDQCASVMRRLQSDCESLDGNANLWRLVLDELAADEELISVHAALRRVIGRVIPDAGVRQQEELRSYLAMTSAGAVDGDDEVTPAMRLTAEQVRLLRRPIVRKLLAGEAAWRSLVEANTPKSLRQNWPRDLVEAVAARVVESPLIRDRLLAWLVPSHREVHPLVASLLHASGIGWKPEPPRFFGIKEGRLNLSGAFLDEADWAGVDLAGCSLNDAVFSWANLSGANLKQATAVRANFDGADLQRAKLSHLFAMNASFVRANLSSTHGTNVELTNANLSFADLTDATLTGLQLPLAILERATFRRASLKLVKLFGARIDEADFTEANLEQADLSDLDLTVACFEGARFAKAQMCRCKLEGMELPRAGFEGANLRGALLTESVMPHAQFARADLQGTGLADIEWEHANLRGADLRGATFHMGSTRSGLVGSSVPMHGSRTGYYTNDLDEQDFKSPEEIRKANLRGADLRGARIDGVDFYLVDLREALYDSDQAEQLRRTGAILESKAR